MNSPPPLPDTTNIEWALFSEIQGFLSYEARLLDGGSYSEWLGLLCEDIHYWMPTMEHSMNSQSVHQYSASALAYFDDDLRSLGLRVAKLSDYTAWTENPPTRQCRIVSNIEIERTANVNEFIVHSTFIHHRGMSDRDEFYLAGRREDLLRREEGGLRLAKRLIVINQHVFPARNINVFF